MADLGTSDAVGYAGLGGVMLEMNEAPVSNLRLGRYVLQHMLGEGGNGQVWLAWQDNELGEPLPFVVKFPRSKYAADVKHRERTLQEARYISRLKGHPNILGIIDFGVFVGMPYIVMEHIDGVELEALLDHARQRRRPLQLGAAYHVLASAAEALHHAHQGATIEGKPVKIVHCDVKPPNFMVSRDGQIKLADFGISKSLTTPRAESLFQGTPRYMSPEHVRGQVHPSMDIYSLGVVGWEMLENRKFREGAEQSGHLLAIMDDDIPPMTNPDVPAMLRTLIQACMKPQPAQRPTAREFVVTLRRCPGYSRDPEDLVQEVISTSGSDRRSSGRTKHDMVAAPVRAATSAALSEALGVSLDGAMLMSTVRGGTMEAPIVPPVARGPDTGDETIERPPCVALSDVAIEPAVIDLDEEDEPNTDLRYARRETVTGPQTDHETDAPHVPRPHARRHETEDPTAARPGLQRETVTGPQLQIQGPGTDPMGDAVLMIRRFAVTLAPGTVPDPDAPTFRHRPDPKSAPFYQAVSGPLVGAPATVPTLAVRTMEASAPRPRTPAKPRRKPFPSRIHLVILACFALGVSLVVAMRLGWGEPTPRVSIPSTNAVAIERCEDDS